MSLVAKARAMILASSAYASGDLIRCTHFDDIFQGSDVTKDAKQQALYQLCQEGKLTKHTEGVYYRAGRRQEVLRMAWR